MDHAVQIAALEADGEAPGFAWFMEQGLGKTLVSWRRFQYLVKHGLATRKIVFTPNSFKGGWADEAEKWGIEADIHIYESGSNTNQYFLRKAWKKPPVIVINYEAIRTAGAQEVLSQFMVGRRTMMTADESIQLKGHDSQQTVAAIKLAKMAAYKRILTGKPIVQGPQDLWGQMRFIGNLDGFNYFAFRNAFCKMGGFKGKQIVGAQNEDILAERIEPWIFRATKADWTDLPPKMYTQRDYQMSPEMRSMYKSMEDEFVLWLESGEAVTVDAAITKYIKLAQIQSGFIIDENERVTELVSPDKNPRVGLLKDVIRDEVVGKVTIPYRHRYVRGMLERQLADLQPACIGGGMPPEEIEQQKNRFNNDPNCRAILLQMSAAKYGHTLLGGPEPQNRCSTSIIFENSYSGDDRSQIDDRIHRHGQTAASVTYINLVGTKLDREMIKAQERKENIFQAVFRNIRSLRG